MKNNSITFYKLKNKKITIFENLKKQKNNYKLIIRNTFILCILFIIFFSSFIIYNLSKINNFTAKTSFKNIIPTEKMNDSSINLEVFKISFKEKYEILVNKANPINEDIVSLYEIVDVKDNLFENIKLEKETYNNYLKLKQAINERGYYLNVKSGFRSFDDSLNIYNDYKQKYGETYAEKYVAKPGVSEHNTGLALDIVISNNENAVSNNYQSDEYKLLDNIAYLYGFIIRYPKDKENITGYSYEPWHLRYVGKQLAKYLTKNNLTLEEYYQSKEY